MRTNILLGRGVEGCGNTMAAVQMQRVVGGDIYATDDRIWPRYKSIKFPQTLFTGADAAACERVARKLNETSDLVVIYSVPSSGHPEACQANFVTLVRNLTVPTVLINVDHNILSIRRNARYDDICNAVDLLMTHSLQNDFCKWAKENLITTKIVKMGVGFNYDEHRAKYWRPIEEQQYNVVRWIGRLAGWKGPTLMIKFHEEQLMDSGFITILEGLEANVGYFNILYRETEQLEDGKVRGKPGTRYNVQSFFRPEKWLGDELFNVSLHGKEVVGKGAYLYKPYGNDECMRRMASSAFGSDLYHLKPQFYGNNIENCHAEIVACGAIPIFHKHFGDNLIHKKQGKPATQCRNTGTIFLDNTNFAECQQQMLKLAADDQLRNDWREQAYEFWREHSSATDVVQDIIAQSINHKTALKRGG